MKKELASLTLAVVMCLSLCVPAFAYASEAADKEQVIEISKQMILRFIEQREAEYYDIKSVDFEIGESESSPDGLSFNINATIMHELKATSAEDLPYIQGMLSAIATEPASLALASAQENVFDVKVADVESYIGETTRMNLYFNVTVNMDGLSSLTEKDIQLYALDSSDNKVAITELNTPSYQEMFNQGYSNVETTLMEIREAGENSVLARGATPISNYDSYDRIAARDYAYEWWGPSDSDYNPAYSNWNSSGGDCANFVSQCIKAGGVPTDSTWKKDSSAWISTSKLAAYMVNNGYATKESYTDTNAGNFATKPGHSVLVSINNTIDVCYTAHNTNRQDAPFSSTELTSTYSFYVIKNY